MKQIRSSSPITIGHSILMSLIVIFGILLFSPLVFLLQDSIGKENAVLSYYLLGMGISFLIIFFIWKKKTKTISFNFKVDKVKIIPVIMIASLALVVGIIQPLTELVPMTDSFKETIKELAGQKGISTFILMVVAAPFLEELIFRGILLEGLLKRYSPLKAILVASALFGVVHLNPWQFLAGFILGIFIGWIYSKNHNLTLSILIHATVNLYGYGIRFVTDDNTILDSGINYYGGLVNYVLVLSVSIAVFICCVILYMSSISKCN